jgi:[acyl-carrier-protein] S-malonyltransferase
MKKAYVFPGQGAQFPGMAKSLYESNLVAKQMLETANDILGFRITDIMFNGTADELKATKVTQPAIFLHSVTLAKCYEGFKPNMVAGHSLGEFSALAAAEAIKFEDALKLVSIRATEMQKCCEKVPGTMAAIIGLDNEQGGGYLQDLQRSRHSCEFQLRWPDCHLRRDRVCKRGLREGKSRRSKTSLAASSRRCLPFTFDGAGPHRAWKGHTGN